MDDYLVIGSGIGGLAAACLLAKKGHGVTILEADQERFGGYAQSFEDNGYTYCYGPQYLWNFGEGEIGNRFLKKLGLENEVPLVPLDPDGYDRIHIGKDEVITVPFGWQRFRDQLIEKFPESKKSLESFFGLAQRIYEVMRYSEEQGLSYGGIANPLDAALDVLKGRFSLAGAFETARYSFSSLEDIYNDLEMPPELRTILYAHQGVLVESARDVLFSVYIGTSMHFNRGLYHPKNHMHGLVDALVNCLKRNGGRMLLGERVTELGMRGTSAVSARTANGAEYSAKRFISNIDPSSTLKLMKPRSFMHGFNVPEYEYSNTLLVFYIGARIKDIKKTALTNGNIWYFRDENVDSRIFLDDAEFDKPPHYLYLNSHSLFSPSAAIAPEGGYAITGGVPCSYRQFAKYREGGEAVLQERLDEFKEVMLAFLDRNLVPGIAENVESFVFRTPLDNERIISAPLGNIYARRFTSANFKFVPFQAGLTNVYFSNAHVSGPGVVSCINGASHLYKMLTGDTV